MSARGTTNGNARGNAEDRRRRRAFLVETYRADVDVLHGAELEVIAAVPISDGRGALEGDGWRKACRCYRCGELLTVDTVTVDRIVPGCRGGRYVRNNIRPACATCNSETGGATRSKPTKREAAHA